MDGPQLDRDSPFLSHFLHMSLCISLGQSIPVQSFCYISYNSVLLVYKSAFVLLHSQFQSVYKAELCLNLHTSVLTFAMFSA